MSILVPGTEVVGAFFASRLIACLLARFAPHGVLLLAFQVIVRLSLTVCLLSCVLAALGGFAPVVLPSLGPLAFSLHDPGHPV